MSEPNKPTLSVEETKSMITPYAFAVEEKLFGLPLATPNRRGGAILVDSMIVGLLAQQDVALLAILLAATFFKAGARKEQVLKWRRTRKFFRVLGLLLIMLVGYSLIDGVVEQYQSEPVAAEQKVTALSDDNEKSQDTAQATNITDWLKGIIENDLGFGFGWAALYFTAFTAWWSGQTPGKRLFGIRVIRLDGKPINLWDAFGRYGGYGAGFATGLLGFFQIYWDPNRQAIHDKISATVVIQGNVNLKTSK